MSIDIAQAITETTGFDKVVITIDSIELVDDTMNFLRSEYGDEVTVQTASDQQGDDIAQSIDTIGGNADLGAMAALFASLLVVGFIMVIITKERVNEIGVLKAIGLPNSKIVTQFLSESIFMASLGFVVCILITLVAGPMMQTMLIESGQMMHHQHKKNQLHNSFNLAKSSTLLQNQTPWIQLPRWIFQSMQRV